MISVDFKNLCENTGYYILFALQLLMSMNTESAALRKLSDDGEFQGGQRRKSALFNDRPGEGICC